LQLYIFKQRDLINQAKINFKSRF